VPLGGSRITFVRFTPFLRFLTKIGCPEPNLEFPSWISINGGARAPQSWVKFRGKWKRPQKYKGITENSLAGAVGDPFQRVQFRANADPPSLPQNFLGEIEAEITAQGRSRNSFVRFSLPNVFWLRVDPLSELWSFRPRSSKTRALRAPKLGAGHFWGKPT